MFLARFQVVSSLLISLFCFSCAPNHGDSTQSAQTLNVLNGKYAKSETLIGRSTVFIYGGNSGNCTGSILSPNIILTAAHCVTDVSKPNERVLMSPSQLSVRNDFGGFFNSAIVVDKILVPNEYYSITDYKRYLFGKDIALLRLSKSLPREYVTVVLESDQNQVYQQTLQFAGYGDLAVEMNDIDSNTSASLFFGQILAKDTIQLGNGNAQVASLPELSYFLTFKIGKRNASAPCHGDSGGPIYYEKEGRIHQVAVLVGVHFENTFEYEKYRCGLVTSTEVASTVFGTNLDFIKNGYRELTGASLF
jgi:secreted trypsin-like serine protease